jgi:hypothetical protein
MSGFIDPNAVRDQAERLRALAQTLWAEAEDLDDLADLIRQVQDAADDGEAANDSEAE